jgi:predicted acylesterase/phospholipase RssA
MMKGSGNAARYSEPRTYLACLLGMILIFLTAVPGANANEKDRCEGTKKQRRQEMELRQIGDEQFAAMLDEYRRETRTDRQRIADTVLHRLERKYKNHLDTGSPFIYDILVLSGGGAKGAFGAGFMQGWGTIPPGPNARPQFDMVTGVSTGALIAPFASIGTDEAYMSVADFYANPERNWIRKRGAFFFKEGHVSLFNNCYLQDTIRGAVTKPVVQSLADAAADDRLLLIGTVNLDAGAGRVFDLGHEARLALESEAFDRIHSILLASSAIPGIFPPMEIDGMLYADGGAASNLFLAGFSRTNGPIARFSARHPDALTPKVRVWVLVNGWLQPEPAVTQPRWAPVAGNALDIMMSTTQLYALELIRTLVYEARVERGLDAEFYLTAIPAETPRNEALETFDKGAMVEMEELGRARGADPSSWKNEIPSAFWPDGS